LIDAQLPLAASPLFAVPRFRLLISPAADSALRFDAFAVAAPAALPAFATIFADYASLAAALLTPRWKLLLMLAGTCQILREAAARLCMLKLYC